MKLSIIIVNYNTRAVTSELIESLLAQDLPNRTEIIVVDNASPDESVAFLRSDYPEIKVIANPRNVGLAAGVNTALKEAKGEYYLILNPDMIALRRSVSALIEFMDKNPTVGMSGGKLISPNRKLQYSCFRFYRLMTVIYRRSWIGQSRVGQAEVARFLMKDFDHRSVRDVEWLLGACMAVRAQAVKKVGGMDERFFMYFEDVDWCRRMWQAGWRVVYVPQAVFSHYYQQSSRRGSWASLFSSRPAREHIKSALKYFWKYRSQPLPVTSADSNKLFAPDPAK